MTICSSDQFFDYHGVENIHMCLALKSRSVFAIKAYEVSLSLGMAAIAIKATERRLKTKWTVIPAPATSKMGGQCRETLSIASR